MSYLSPLKDTDLGFIIDTVNTFTQPSLIESIGWLGLQFFKQALIAFILSIKRLPKCGGG